MNATIPTPLAAARIDPELESFFAQAGELIDQAQTQQQEIDRVQATRFNLLSMIDPDENKLSDILADFLDPLGTHGQGDRFLSLWLDQLQPGLSQNLNSQPRVRREAPTFTIEQFRRRLDILIESDVVVGIENKVNSPDQTNQVKHYLEHLGKRSGASPWMLIYLTPNGRPPGSLSLEELQSHCTAGRLHLWSYSKTVRTWLESCVAVCKADKVRQFLMDFIAYIETDLKREDVENVSEGNP